MDSVGTLEHGRVDERAGSKTSSYAAPLARHQPAVGVVAARWLERFARFHDFVASGEFPQRKAKSAAERELYAWSYDQRKQHAREGGSALTAEQIKLLEGIPGWNWKVKLGAAPREDEWETHRQEFVSFYAEHRRLPSSHAETEDERSLGHWVKNQLDRLGGREDDTSLRRQEILMNTEGWPPMSRRLAAFFEVAEQVEAFRAEHGRLPRQSPAPSDSIPAEVLAHERRLGAWCRDQRRLRQVATEAKPYSIERQRRLEAIPNWRWSRSRGTRGPSQ